jgi:hypothetical protein
MAASMAKMAKINENQRSENSAGVSESYQWRHRNDKYRKKERKKIGVKRKAMKGRKSAAAASAKMSGGGGGIEKAKAGWRNEIINRGDSSGGSPAWRR